ncbi:MAG: type I toxin-antitoxin system Fst family toxin [Lactobacillus sp.]|jgi:hypothetical protein|nr:type I toxin-antitoxin system Fst family toxin [Lactobacillus sp.]MCH3905552.1 type I toxin-antitoxin system Fst family toxin [Lactobacillus sp.]MCH3990879.1 type I toxin-antitoxin system Fst family toxin [Lactobacillus sp.]MCH4068405.1 type I toxin-antitoxin system Fst family toxin [Lactobacillus sp.]MCI1304418.1 type I toxin-antitoxin system Fst family toxin [Lactobacillus sp.]
MESIFQYVVAPILVGIILQLFADWLDRQRHDK